MILMLLLVGWAPAVPSCVLSEFQGSRASVLCLPLSWKRGDLFPCSPDRQRIVWIMNISSG